MPFYFEGGFSIHNVYVIFSLPYKFDLPFVLMNDTIHTHFNHPNDELNCLIPMLCMQIPGVFMLIGENEILSKSFLQMLQQGSNRSRYFDLIFLDPKIFYL